MTVENGGPEFDAIRALIARGVDRPEDLLGFATTERIMATVEWWDGLSGVTHRLLAKRIREGGVEPSASAASSGDVAAAKRQEKRDRFEKVAERFPVGSVTETHQRMAARCWPKDDEQCVGRMVVLDALYPAVAVRCDGCGFEASYPLRAAFDVLPSAPLQVGVGEPPVPKPGPMTAPPLAAFAERDRRAKELAGRILRDAGVRPVRTSTEAA